MVHDNRYNMGNWRFISKYFKRKAFRKSRIIADNAAIHVYEKYYFKFLNKFRKNNIPVYGLTSYQAELLRKLTIEKGVAHGKTREYWLLRGPRLFLTVLLGVILNIGCNQTIQNNPDIIGSISSGVILLIVSAYMLYQRLPDSILASLMRVGHDHYNDWKETTFHLPS